MTGKEAGAGGALLSVVTEASSLGDCGEWPSGGLEVVEVPGGDTTRPVECLPAPLHHSQHV